MKLRSGTIVTTDNRKKCASSSSNNNINKYSETLKDKLYMCEKYPCSTSIKNLNYIERVYEQINEEYFELLEGVEYSKMPNSIVNLTMIKYKKTLELMSDLIGKTYDKKSEEYDNSTKEMIVKLLYKMRKVFVRLRRILYEMEDESKYIKTLLNVSVENAGKPIKDTSSMEALVYYCYSHLYGNEEINRYDIHTYEDGVYGYGEIYDYYFGGHIEMNIEDDMFIRDDYKYWFVYKETIEKYNLYGYKRHKLKPLYDFYELKSRIEYHKDEVNKYFEMMAEMYPEEMEEMYPEVMEEILYIQKRQREEDDDE